MYFITKPLFFALDYFFKLLGNNGLAIIAVTVCIRLVFFPLANFSFKSMGKMKLLAPEMARLKELHKDDKMKLQQAMMALYKKEGGSQGSKPKTLNKDVGSLSLKSCIHP